MAERRMFSKSVIDSDMFLDMPLSAQALYFHLAMRADDDGFVNNPKKIQRMVGASDDDCKILVAKKFIIPFESGIVVIRHWKIHNYIQKDRYKETVYLDEKAQISTDGIGAYVSEPCPTCIQPVSKVDTQVSIGKVSIGKESVDKDSKGENKTRRERRFTPPTLEEVSAYCRELNSKIDPQQFIDYYTANGWVQGKGKPIKDWKAAVRTWNRRESTFEANGSKTEAKRKQNEASEKQEQTESNKENKKEKEGENKIEIENKKKSYDADGFATFWAAYPKKAGKADALKAWNKLAPDVVLQEQMGKALEMQKQSQQWRKDGGQYIPMPATWLNGRRWEDEAPQAQSQESQFDRMMAWAKEFDEKHGSV